ncbi:RDD family protein, partial [Microbacterium barkeri]|uniref:RDD family protein n=1 Tax=Microbacterium barkeri TaxID=33917 RepID=UPI003F169CAA
MTASNPHRALLPPGYGLPAAAPAPRPAPLGRRAGAYIVDMLIVGAVMSVLSGVTVWVAMNGPLWLTLTLSAVVGLLAIGWVLLYSWWQGTRRGTPGMRALRVRLVRDDDGAPLGFGRAFLRNVIWGLGAAIVVGYFSPLFDGSPWHRGWHDRVAGSRMVDADSARDAAPLDQASAPAAPAAPAAAVPPLPA